MLLENCNAVKNGGYGINAANFGANDVSKVHARSCGFGSGTQANSSGATGSSSAVGIVVLENLDAVTYAANLTPWRDPESGEFTIVLGAALAAGRGTFLGTTNTQGYPAIGAAQPRQLPFVRSPFIEVTR
jgi:hypothetical protein